MNARRITRWLRLFVACFAFLVATPRPAVMVDAVDRIVLVAGEEAREEARAVEAPSADVPAIATEAAPALAFEAPRLVSHRWLTNCALLL